MDVSVGRVVGRQRLRIAMICILPLDYEYRSPKYDLLLAFLNPDRVSMNGVI
jgi:hypothetical protein